VLRDAGILTDSAGKIGRKQLDPVEASEIAGRILRTFTEQSEGWRKRNLFERQWITRDFKKSTGYSPDDMHSKLQEIQGVLKGGKAPGDSSDTLKKLESYWIHQQELLRGYERDKAKLESSLKTMDAWVKDLRDLIALLSAQ
jgi:hypothetical protein